MAERLKAVVLKTINTQVFKGSNPFASSKIMRFFKWSWNLCFTVGKKIAIAFFHLIFITIFCTLPHELGHALAANCFSWRVDHIMINFTHSSDHWFSFNLFKYEIRLGKIPLIGGYTRHEGRSNLIIISAGLLVNLLLVLLAWWAERKVKNKFWKSFLEWLTNTIF